MANQNTQNKNRNVVVGALSFSKQPAGVAPIGSTEYGMYVDSNGKLVSSFNGLAGSVAALGGIIPAARLAMPNQPADTNTIAIGGKTFQFLNTLGAAGANVQVKIGAAASNTRAALIKAINGTVSAAEWVEATTPFAVAVVADEVSTSVRVRNATARGGTALAAAGPNVALAEAITDAADVWNCANLNVSGKAPSDHRIVAGSVAITAAMITATSFFIELPFTPSAIEWGGYASTGIPRAINEAVTISGNAIQLAFAGGVSPNWQATDTFRFLAIE